MAQCDFVQGCQVLEGLKLFYTPSQAQGALWGRLGRQT